MTEQQARFAAEYIIDCNATQAAIRAGYSAKCANIQGPRLLSNVSIRAEIDRMMAAKHDDLIANQDEVLRYLTTVMRREAQEHVVVTTTNEVSDYAPDATGTMRKRTRKTEEPQVIPIPARLSDANKAAELLGKRYSLFTDRLDVDGDLDLNITVDYGD